MPFPPPPTVFNETPSLEQIASVVNRKSGDSAVEYELGDSENAQHAKFAPPECDDAP